jgi:hypothetical protein
MGSESKGEGPELYRVRKVRRQQKTTDVEGWSNPEKEGGREGGREGEVEGMRFTPSFPS